MIGFDSGYKQVSLDPLRLEGSLAVYIPSVHSGLWLKQDHVYFLIGYWLVLLSVWDNHKFSLSDGQFAVTQ